MRHSLRRYLLAWIIGPIALFVVFDTISLYRSAMASIDTAYDRSLLASARFIGEQLRVRDGRVQADVPYTALEIFEAGVPGRMAYRISDFDGNFLAGYEDLPRYTGKLPQRGAYPALIDFYDATYRDEAVRMAALYQPVASEGVLGVALVQVAETRGVREALTQRILRDTLMRQGALLAVVAIVTAVVVTRAMRPLERLRKEVVARDERDLSPVGTPDLPHEVLPVVHAINDLMQRLQRRIGHQRQFVRDASHQLRTPLAVLKTQLQNAMGSVRKPGSVVTPQEARLALEQMHRTVERAIRLANQMLALAKVEQVHGDEAPSRVDLAELAREVALDLSPLIGEKNLDFELRAVPAFVRGHAWMLRELIRNLLHNAIRETPYGAALLLIVGGDGAQTQLTVRDTGPGLAEALRERLFEPFHTGHPTSGSGLGLAICLEVAQRHGGRIALVNRMQAGTVMGLDAVLTLPAA